MFKINKLNRIRKRRSIQSVNDKIFLIKCNLYLRRLLRLGMGWTWRPSRRRLPTYKILTNYSTTAWVATWLRRRPSQAKEATTCSLKANRRGSGNCLVTLYIRTTKCTYLLHCHCREAMFRIYDRTLEDNDCCFLCLDGRPWIHRQDHTQMPL